MNKNYFLKKKLSNILKSLVSSLLKGVTRFFKTIFAKRTILFVTKQKIRSVNLGPLSQIAIILAIAWIANFFFQSTQYTKIIDAKSEEIDNLKSANSYFKDQFEDVNEKLKIVNNYLISISGMKQQVKAQEPNFKKPDNVKGEKLSGSDKHTLREIQNANLALSDIHALALGRIKDIESAIALTGLNLKKSPAAKVSRRNKNTEKEIALNGKNGLTNRQGGPISAAEEAALSNKSDSKGSIEQHLEKAQFANEIDRLLMLEKLISVMPLTRPMKNYYISSSFGTRVDPITGGRASHHGLDFVGSIREKIISPSSGKVILAGKFSGYGNAIVIDHGFGITTRYGHLSAIKVTEGQIVKKGDLIALQGSTGRSTGPHLHYEVRYKDIPLNPKKFLEAGDALFNDQKTAKYVNS